MELTTLCAVVASLRVDPNRAQFFQYETVFLSCGDQDNTSEWTIKRNTSIHTNQENPAQNKSSWFWNGNIYPTDAGVYWCESEGGQCGGAVNITVTAGDVILESPVLPVTEGDSVTLRCIINPENPSSGGSFGFYKGGSPIGNSSSGDLTLPSVSLSNSGLYVCEYGGELSAESRLVVVKRAGRPPQHREASSTITYAVAFPVTAAVLVLVCALLLCRWRKRKGENREVRFSNVATAPEPTRLREHENHDVPYYGNVVSAQTLQPQRERRLKEPENDDFAYYGNVATAQTGQPRRLKGAASEDRLRGSQLTGRQSSRQLQQLSQ